MGTKTNKTINDSHYLLILLLGLAMALFLAGAGLYFFKTDPEVVANLFLVLVAHSLGGRAAGIGLCIINGYSHTLTIVYNFYLEVLIVCFAFSVVMLSINNRIEFRALKYYSLLLERKARRHKEKIEKYGWLGIFFFVMLPLPMTGPVVGSIVGSLLKFRLIKNLSATFLGTFIAIAVWTLFFDFLEQHLKIIRYLLAAIIAFAFLSYAREIKNFIKKNFL